MKNNTNRVIAWSLCVLCILGAGTSFVFWLIQTSMQFSLVELVNALGWSLAMPLVFSILAALVITRQSGNRVGWLMMVVALASVNAFSSILEYLYPVQPDLTPGLWLLIWFDNFSWIFLIFPIFLIPLHFPTGRPPSRRWNWVNFLALGLALFLIVSGIFVDSIGPNNAVWVVSNPIGFIPTEFFEGPFLILWGLGLLTMFAGSIAALFARYRRAHSIERQQIKWLLYACAFFLVVYGLAYFLIPPDSTEAWGNIWFVLGMLVIPAAIAIAILRYRLYDIDILIRRTLVYTVLTAILALVYFGSVVLLQSLFEGLAGQQSPAAIVISTLAIAALFTPLRRRVQDAIDRRFYRRKYDAARALESFATSARDETDVQQLTTELIKVVDETIQPELMSLWIKEQK